MSQETSFQVCRFYKPGQSTPRTDNFDHFLHRNLNDIATKYKLTVVFYMVTEHKLTVVFYIVTEYKLIVVFKVSHLEQT